MKLSLKQRLMNFVGLVFVFFLQIIDNINREMNLNIPGLNALKNIFLLLLCCMFIWEVYHLYRKGNKLIFVDETKSVVKLTIIFALLSVYYILKNDGFNIATVEGLVRILVPIVVAFAALNVMTIDEIYQFMCVMLIISFVGYLYTIGLSNLTLANILSVSILKSHSPFESNFFSPIAVSFCLFFCYYRKNKVLMFLSVIFTIMTFKRIMIFYSIFLLLFGWLFKTSYQVPKWLIWVYKIVFLMLSLFYISLMLGTVGDVIYQYFGINVNDFSMGRSWLMQNIYNKFTSYGFMTSTVEFRSMEMDIPQFYIEMGLFSIIAVIHYITNIAKRNWYNFLIIIFCMLELLTSHWIDIVYFWMIMYITIGCVAYKDKQNIMSKRKVRFVFNNKQKHV